MWNYPHWKYRIDSRKVLVDEAVRIITGSTGQTTYAFNPAAKKFVSVLMILTHSEAFKNEIMTSSVALADRYKELTYTYILELNDAGEIIGGEWVSASQRDHPDFIWVALEPVHGSGSADGSNPNLETQEVLKLWAESVGVDPANPPPLLMEPSIVKDWGRFPKFDLLVNGAQIGVAFAFEEAVEISVKPKPTLAGAAIEGVLDGSKLTFSSLKVSIPKMSSGVHVLDLKWTLANKTVDEQRARIHVIR